MIPLAVKQAVWKRDQDKFIDCGSKDNLHLDHILPFSKGGPLVLVDNIQLLCARHNSKKSDKFL
jgi:5-methylcytosine-specific restriction endonuclease McrA